MGREKKMCPKREKKDSTWGGTGKIKQLHTKVTHVKVNDTDKNTVPLTNMLLQ